MKFFHALMMLPGAFLLLAGGCVPEEMQLRQTKQDRGPVKIAAILPLTGADRAYAFRMLRGAESAVRDLNREHGVNGRSVELLIEDNARHADAMQRAVARGAVAAILGYGTNDVEPLLAEAKRLRIPSVIPLATRSAQMGRNPFVFRTSYTNAQQGEALAAYLWYWRQLLRIAILTDMSPGADYERELARESAQAFRDLGGQVVSVTEYRGDDFENALQETIKCGAQAIMIPAPGARTAKMIARLRELGYKGILCGGDNWDDEELFDNLRSGVDYGECIFISFFSDELNTDEYRLFKKNFLEHYHYEPGSSEAQTYDAVKLLAITLGNNTDIKGFTKSWLALRNCFGAAAIYTMLPRGGIDRTMYVSAIHTKGPYPMARLLNRFQYSKLATYRNDD